MKSLHLLPNVLHEASNWEFDPPPIDALIAESEKGGRQYLKRFYGKIAIPIYLLNEHTQDLGPLLTLAEENIGLVSDAGLPCLADPGSQLVLLAKKRKVAIYAYPGPSSIVLSLMLSGLPAQSFTFHGYLDRDPWLLSKQLSSLSSHTTHIFIETPYRNQKMLEAILKARKPQDLLCVATDLMGSDQTVMTAAICDWTAFSDFHKNSTLQLLAT